MRLGPRAFRVLTVEADRYFRLKFQTSCQDLPYRAAIFEIESPGLAMTWTYGGVLPVDGVVGFGWDGAAGLAAVFADTAPDLEPVFPVVEIAATANLYVVDAVRPATVTDVPEDVVAADPSRYTW